nr:MAG TPA: Terminase small subunit [Caudoviricetes sp.]DAS03369.1 MAG TPA: Terminase small subunit [Caudoviricetes sp.]
MSKLTTKQEIFVQQLVAGQSQRQAYRQAYNAEKMTDKTVDEKASKLFKDGKVRARYRALLKQFSNMALWSREQAFNEYEWLKNKAKVSIEKEGVRQANSNAFLASLEGMNNMSFNDLELADKKLKLEIEKLQSQIGGDSEQDDKLIDFAKALRGAFNDE